MRINREEAERAGKLTNKAYGWTDEELKIMIKFEGLFLAFLEGKGERWWLATCKMRAELNEFKSFVYRRQL